MKKISAIALSLILIICALPFNAYANVQLFPGVTQEMCTSAYWADKSDMADEVIMTADEIAKYNKVGIEASGTSLFDLESYNTSYNADKQRASLAEAVKTDYYNADKTELKRKYFVDGVQLDKSYFENIIDMILATGFTGENLPVLYGICTKQGDIMSIPTDDVIGYSENDPDSEGQIAELKIGDPCIVKQKCEIGGKTFYYIVYDSLYGWINAENIGICKTRAEWLDAWKTDIDGKDFLVITGDKVVTEKSLKVPSTSEVKLTLGSTVKLVPKEEIPENIGERNSWNNYTVYLPTRDNEGNYVKQAALISQHCKVNVGYLEMTERNILNVSLNCLGNRYGWSGMLDAMDCSLYTRDVYRCFGLSIPRNTTMQQKVTNTKFDVSAKTDAEKQAMLEKSPIGTLLYMPGHTMIYLGSENGVSYVISALGSASEADGELNVKSSYSVVINPLTARRKNAATWISSISSIVYPAHFAGHKYKDKVVAPTYTEKGYTKHTCFMCGDSYNDSYTNTLTRKPNPTSITKLTASKTKRFTVKWKKGTSVNGYQIQYALNSKFTKSKKTVTISNGKTTSKTVTGLKKGKKYYVRVRAYRVVNNKKYYSAWTKAKTVKTK